MAGLGCEAVIDASVHYADIGGLVSVSDEGEVTFGESRLSPYPHAALEYKVLRNEQRTLLICRERHADVLTQWCERDVLVLINDSSKFEEEIGAVLSWPNAAMSMEVIVTDGTPGIRVVTNHNTNTCVYIWSSYIKFHLSWNYNSVARNSDQNSINEHHLSRWLMMHGYVYDSHTIFSNIYRVIVDSDVFVSRHRMRMTQRDRRARYAPRKISRDIPFHDMLEQILTDVIGRRRLESGRISCEVSGGLDSAALLLIASRLIPSLSAAGIAVSPRLDQPVNQTIRQRKMTAILGVPLYLLNITQHLPFSPNSQRHEPFITSYMAEPFHEAFLFLAEELKKSGFDTIISGTGGNEAFPLFPSDDGFSNSYTGLTRSNPVCPFITQKAFLLAQSLQITSSYTLPYVAPALQAVEARHQRLLTQGMWSVNPFLEPEVIQFGSSLPHQLRMDRAIIKDILVSAGMDEFQAEIHDSFESCLGDIVIRAGDVVRLLCRESVCADLGLVDTAALLRCYEDVCRRGGATKDLRQTVFHILMFLHIELFLGHYRRGGHI